MLVRLFSDQEYVIKQRRNILMLRIHTTEACIQCADGKKGISEKEDK